jgi:anti-sigma28 factor (negative regulator of flagellin synthesis)
MVAGLPYFTEMNQTVRGEGGETVQLSRDEYLRVSQLRPSQTGNSAIGTITTAPARRAGGDAFSTTPDMGEARHVAEAMGGLPDVREEIVASLRARIEAGVYHVSGDNIAEMMVRRLLADRVR